MKPARGATAIITAILISLTLVAGSAIFWYQKTPPKIPDMSKELAQQQSPIARPTTDETTNWKTYTNSKYKYSLQYEPNLKLNVVKDRPNITNNDNNGEHYFNFSIDVSENSKNLSTQEFVNTASIMQASGNYKNPYTSPKPYNKGQINGIIAEYSNGDDSFVSVVQARDGKIFEFKLIAGPDTGTKATDDDRVIFDQILSTFKFTE